jgi:hypothetical protein
MLDRRIFLLLATSSLFADKAPQSEETSIPPPWFTGPLIAQSSEIMPRGYYNFEQYLFATAITGAYDSDWSVIEIPTLWNIQLSPEAIVGLTSWMDIYVQPTFAFNTSEGISALTWNDLIAGFDFQLYHDTNWEHWIPNFKFAIHEVFPTGQYDRLNPRKLRTQLSGEGAYSTQFQLIIGKMIHLSGVHFMSSRFMITYQVSAPTRLRGYNLYGGSYNTNLRIQPAQQFNLDFAVELSLAQSWSVALDVIGNWTSEIRYKGNLGTTPSGAPANFAGNPSFQFSLAPALEYNWNANLGLIAGAWFTTCGKASVRFASGVVAINYYR